MVMHNRSVLVDDNMKFGYRKDDGKNQDQVETINGNLVSSLNDFPDDVLQICLARVPLRYIPRVKAVCKRWYELGDSQSLYCLRRNLGLTESWTYVLANEYEQGSFKGLQGRAYDPDFHWSHLIAPLNCPQRLQFASCAGCDGMLYILGGRSPLISRKPNAWVVYSRVDVYDPICNSWHNVQSMRTPRFGFAVGSFTHHATHEGQLIVAGGYNACGLALPLAEVYDPKKDEWHEIPSMQKMSGACRGEVYDGKFYVKQANNGPDAVEVYDPSVCSWGVCTQESAKQCFQIFNKVWSRGSTRLQL